METRTTDLKIFIGLGIAALVLSVTLPLYLGVISILKYQPTEPSSATSSQMYNEPLGEMGSHCGGPARLPCKPGTNCDNDPKVPDSIGNCVGATSTGATAESGQACDPSKAQACSVGLYCKKTDATAQAGICASFDATAPHVVSIKLEGMSPSSGGYVAADGTKATVRVQTLNATSIEMHLEPVEGGGWAGVSLLLGTAVKSTGGIFTAPLQVHDLDADLVVTVRNAKGESSSLSVHVASVK